MGRDGGAEHIAGQAVTARFFEVLGIQPIAGIGICSPPVM